MKEQSASGILGTTIEKIRDLVDVSTNHWRSDVSGGRDDDHSSIKGNLWFCFGGSDFPSKTNAQLFWRRRGGGAGVTITPVAFLIVSDGEVTLKHITAYDNAAERVVNLVPEMFDKVTSVVNKTIKKKETQQAEAEQAANAAEVTIEEVK